MNKKTKKLVILSVVFVLIGIASSLEISSYLLMQATGQFNVLWNAKPIDDFLEDDAVELELKKKILLVEEVQQFAQSSLGLESYQLYTTIYDQQGQDILWNLSACEPYQLKSVEWYFPIVGSVSYKGFFDFNRAKNEEQLMKDKGYDTRIRSVNAWSTLGWFADPILSKNLKRQEGSLAELFIHEITHANVFLKDSLTFNENLASFIGEQGAVLFLIDKYGKGSSELLDYQNKGKDTQQFIEHCLIGVQELGVLYTELEESMSDYQKSKAKQEYLKSWVMRLDSMSFSDKNLYHGRFEEKLPNNAFFMAFDRYDSKKKYFQEQFENQFDGNLKSFIDLYKSGN